MNPISNSPAFKDRLDVAEFVKRLFAGGYRLVLRGSDGLRVAPPLPPDLQSETKERKREICHYLLRAPWSLVTDPALPDPWPPIYTFPISWQQEYAQELDLLTWRLHGCADPEVRARLRDLMAAPAPTTVAEWLDLGHRWQAAEHELRQQGRLPVVPWPVRQNLQS